MFYGTPACLQNACQNWCPQVLHTSGAGAWWRSGPANTFAMPDSIFSAQSFGPDYMIVADGSLLSYALQISKMKKNKSPIAVISFFILTEGETQRKRKVQGTCVNCSEKWQNINPHILLCKRNGEWGILTYDSVSLYFIAHCSLFILASTQMSLKGTYPFCKCKA